MKLLQIISLVLVYVLCGNYVVWFHQGFHETIIGQLETKYFVQKPDKQPDPFNEIEKRIEKDAINKQKVCAKYLGSINPWLPVKPKLNVYYYYLDRMRKLGWCVNAKVSNIYFIKI